jgi:transcription elongation factor Elf1
MKKSKLLECYFTPNDKTSSATICANCGKEKMLHIVGKGIKASICIIKTQREEPYQEICNNCGKTLREQTQRGCNEISCYRQFLKR